MLAHTVQGLRGHRRALVPGGRGTVPTKKGSYPKLQGQGRRGKKSSTGAFMEGSLWGHPDDSEKTARDSIAEMWSGAARRKTYAARRNQRDVVDSDLTGVCTRETRRERAEWGKDPNRSQGKEASCCEGGDREF